MTELQCPWCGYDARASAVTGICSECGRPLDALGQRRRFLRRSSYWLVAAAAIATIATLMRTLNFGMFPAAVALVMAILITGGGAAVALRRPLELRRLEAVVWIRVSFWLHLPWIGMPFAVLLSSLCLRLLTLGMQPGDRRINDAFWRSGGLLQLMFYALPLLGLGLWIWRWRRLQRAAALPRRNDTLPTVVAIVSTFLAWAWGFLDLAFYYVGV